MILTCSDYQLFLLILVIFPFNTLSLPDQGKWSLVLNQDSTPFVGVAKSLFKDSTVSIAVSCTPEGKDGSDTDLRIGWMIRQTPCYEEYLAPQLSELYELYYQCPNIALESSYNAVRSLKSNLSFEKCTHTIDLKEVTIGLQLQEVITDCTHHKNLAQKPINSIPANEERFLPKPESQIGKLDHGIKLKRNAIDISKPKNIGSPAVNSISTTTTAPVVFPDPLKSPDHLVTVDQDGVYLIVVYIEFAGNEARNFTATVDIKLQGPHGYLSAVDWPLLPFYAVMCGIYVVYAIIWLVVSALQWRDLLRIQFWIGGVIFLGLVEKAVFYAEYQYINSTGQSGHGGMLFAEVMSCFKRTLARLLVIIVSLGFGIVKPRLGPALHRVIGVGALYFTLCSVEGWLRVLKPKNDPSNQTLMAEIPLAVLDSGICWWIFSSLVQTTRTLRLRRNVVKLSLYRHFTNTLIFSVLASIVYMSWSLYNHKLTSCITDWKELWVDEAYWHVLFSLLLLVIMALWRPTVNNQRYSFTPLLDAADEEEVDLLEKESTAMSDIYGTKARGSKSTPGGSGKKEAKNTEDDDLKWVEENIPSSLTDTALPSLLDSDEEIMTVRFERNKME